MNSVHLPCEAFKNLIPTLEKEGPVVLLETQDEGKSLLAFGELASLKCYGERCIIRGKELSGAIEKKMNPWDALREFRGDQRGKWLFGYLGYDLKNHLEKLASENPDAVNAPDLWMISPEMVMRYDAKSELLELITDEGGRGLDKLVSMPAASNVDCSFVMDDASDSDDERLRYTEIVRQAQKEIYEGDYYEINLSRQLMGRIKGDSFALYEQMRGRGAVPFAAYLALDDLQICCSSPERFLKKEGIKLMSQPIKGTAGVSDDEEQNRQIRKELERSEKNKAENLMIVDLVRHDLNSVCRPGSVKVPELFKVHRFPTVFQMISTVEGEIRDGVDPVSAIAACFPMGSMTGAPKISAMKAIERLENYRRGIYSGAIGYINPDDDFDFNVVIRTAICRNGKLLYSSGGAITADSDPEEEWEETRVKTRALRKSDI
ncbi:MAG: anthranilate synthase component I family protein [Balneolia bacterium]|nr:anthranilate synthase component I family protein [Balneolia bacterium]